MDHIAIMSKEIPFLKRILAGTKTIESRWYLSKRLPWKKITPGDHIYFKSVGELVTAQAQVKEVSYFADCNSLEIQKLISTHASKLGLLENEISDFLRQVVHKKYVVFIYLDSVRKIKPFQINKQGFGNMASWITVPDINQIILH